MKAIKFLVLLALPLSLMLSVACESDDDEFTSDGDGAAGGLMYDKWWKAAGVSEPTADHTLWAGQTSNTRSGADTWRCKECHGWDYQGKDGAYSNTSSHYTGFTGVWTARADAAEDIFNALDGGTHNFGDVLTESDLKDLTAFITDDLILVSDYITLATKVATGDATNGKTLYEDTGATGGKCITCHGADGNQIVDFDLGALAIDNPWETLHKIRFGHPGSDMPSTVANELSTQDAADILTYSQALYYAGGDAVAGGMLYDKWWKVADGATEPTTDHSLWAGQTTNTRSGADTWRCKECHGWDYKGADGAYTTTSSHYTGFTGVWASRTDSDKDLFDALNGGTHNFGDVIAAADIQDLTAFIQEQLIDESTLINYDTKAALGDATNGESLYTDTGATGGQCITCHGADGNQIVDFDLGALALDNPWETLHKIRFGHPGTTMPSTVASGLSAAEAVDILTYSQSLGSAGMISQLDR